jgi:hypothetical protein
VSVFVLSLKSEDRTEVEVGNWAKHEKTFYSELLYVHILHILSSFPTITLKLQSSDLQFSNFNAPVIYTSLVIGS